MTTGIHVFLLLFYQLRPHDVMSQFMCVPISIAVTNVPLGMTFQDEKDGLFYELSYCLDGPLRFTAIYTHYLLYWLLYIKLD